MTKKFLKCRQLNLKHIKKNCLNTNKTKREKWKKKFNKKWVFYKKYHQQKKKKNAQKKADNSKLNTSDKPSEIVRKYIMTTRITLSVNQFSNVLNALTTLKLLSITQVWDTFNAITSHLLNFSDL